MAGYAGCQALGAAWLGIAALLVSGTAPAGALAAIADLAPAESPACAAAACALCSTLGAAGLLAANYFVTQALHGSVSLPNHDSISFYLQVSTNIFLFLEIFTLNILYNL